MILLKNVKLKYGRFYSPPHPLKKKQSPKQQQKKLFSREKLVNRYLETLGRFWYFNIIKSINRHALYQVPAETCSKIRMLIWTIFSIDSEVPRVRSWEQSPACGLWLLRRVCARLWLNTLTGLDLHGIVFLTWFFRSSIIGKYLL